MAFPLEADAAHDLDPDDARALLPEVRAIVGEAGAMALPAFRLGARTTARSWSKAGDSPVTEVDLAVDAFLRERLGALLPEAGWLSEETADNPDRLGRALVWIVDPIDGTRAFLNGNPDWSVSVALVRHGRPVLGMVFAPAHRDFYEAVPGDARRNGVSIAVSPRADLSGAGVVGPKPLIDRVDADLRSSGGAGLRRLEKISSLALRLSRVADGSVDLGLVGGRSHDWDIAGADLILEAAGGLLAGRAGHPPVYNAPDPAHSELVAGSVRLVSLTRAALARD